MFFHVVRRCILQFIHKQRLCNHYRRCLLVWNTSNSFGTPIKLTLNSQRTQSEFAKISHRIHIEVAETFEPSYDCLWTVLDYDVVIQLYTLTKVQRASCFNTKMLVRAPSPMEAIPLMFSELISPNHGLFELREDSFFFFFDATLAGD